MDCLYDAVALLFFDILRKCCISIINIHDFLLVFNLLVSVRCWRDGQSFTALACPSDFYIGQRFEALLFCSFCLVKIRLNNYMPIGNWHNFGYIQQLFWAIFGEIICTKNENG